MALRVRLGDQRQMLARPLARQLEGETVHALDAFAREDRGFGGDLFGQSLVHAAAGARVLAFGVLAHDHPVDFICILHVTLNSRKKARGPHIGVLVEALADRQAQTPERDMVGHVGRAHCAEEDGVEAFELLQAACGNVSAGLLVALRRPIEILELQAKAVLQFPQDLDPRGNDLVADPVAGDRRDAVRLQAATLDCARTASATAAPTCEVLALPFMSGVCGPSMMTRSMARTMSAAASAWPRCSSISAPDQMAAIGLAMRRPAMSGAEPCTGSKIEGAVRSGLMLPEAAMPMVPAVAGPRSETMSPKRLLATMTSKRSGLSTIWMVSPSTWYWSARMSG